MILFTTDRDYWERSKHFELFGFEYICSEGFIHCCKPNQLSYVLERFFEDEEEVLVLGIDPEKLEPELRYEQASNGELFPHIYGSINQEAVVHCIDIEREKGQWNIDFISQLRD